MREFQHRHVVRSLLYSKVTLFILLLACILLGRSVVELYGKYMSVSQAKQEAVGKEAEVRKDVEAARAKLSFIQTERGKEEYIRKTFPVAKKEEGVIIVLTSSTSPVTNVKKEVSFSARIMDMIRSLWQQ